MWEVLIKPEYLMFYQICICVFIKPVHYSFHMPLPNQGSDDAWVKMVQSGTLHTN